VTHWQLIISQLVSRSENNVGGPAEWFKATVLKTDSPRVIFSWVFEGKGSSVVPTFNDKLPALARRTREEA